MDKVNPASDLQLNFTERLTIKQDDLELPTRDER